MSKFLLFDDVPCINNVTLFENCCCIIGGFCSNSIYLKSHLLVFFFDKEQQNKDDVPRIKSFSFQENCCCIILGFCSISL